MVTKKQKQKPKPIDGVNGRWWLGGDVLNGSSINSSSLFQDDLTFMDLYSGL